MRFISIGAAFTATISASYAQAQDWNSLSFSRANFTNAGHFQVEISHASRDGRLIWIAKRVEQLPVKGAPEKGAPEQTTWTDSNICPAMMSAFAKLQAIKHYAIMPPTIPDPKAPVEAPTVVMDGAIFQIDAKISWTKDDPLGEIQLRGNYHTPVADWVQETMNVLAPCWSDRRPST